MLTSSFNGIRKSLALVVGGFLFGAAPAVAAQGFNALASPPRFELTTAAGERLRNVLEITNAGVQPAKYRIRTADWTLAPDASVTFYDALQPSSCRPWVSIERNELTIPGSGRARFRFEVAPPVDARSGECRFALLIEGDEPVVTSGDAFRIPVRGRLGIIVYGAVGDAAPKLEVVKIGVDVVGNKRVPTIWVRNIGDAHGRVGGYLTGTDAKGRELEFVPSTFPVLPGETRALALAAQLGPNETVDPELPVTVQGTLEWPRARVPFKHRFE